MKARLPIGSMKREIPVLSCLFLLVTSSLTSLDTTGTAATIYPLTYRAADAEYSDALERIIMVSASPNQLHLYDPVAHTEKIVDLVLAPTSVSVAPDGLTAAVGHDAWVTHVDLANGAVLKTYEVSADALDVVLGGNKYAYVFPRHDQSAHIRSINLETGVETSHTGSTINAGTLAKLHPGGKAIYGADNGSSPSDIEKYSIVNGTAEYEYDSPYHGDYPMCGDLWMSEDGLRIFTKCGNVFRSSELQSEDMLYNGSLKELNAIRHLAHSSEARRVVAIADYSIYYVTIANDTEIQVYNYDYLTIESRIKLPTFVVGSHTYTGHGKFVFFNKDGSKFFVVLEADKTSGLNDGIVQYTFSTAPNPAPILSSISPTEATAGGGELTLTVYGSNFVPGSIVRWGGKDKTALYVSDTELNVSISVEDIAKTGTVSVSVFNPSPSGGASSASTFAIKNPIPSISGLSPTWAAAGAAEFTLTVYGFNLNADSVVRWNGNDRKTVYSSYHLEASISAADIALEGTASVTVFNPTPGGGTSGSRSFTIEDPLPVITSLSPSTIAAGGGSFNLYVSGRKFVSGSVVRWNGSDRTTFFSGSFDLSATIPVSDTTTPGTAHVTVYNPSPNSAVSNTKSFTITGGVPTFSITMTKTSYSGTDAVGVSSMTLKNPDASAQRIKLKVWMKIPTIGQVNLIDLGSDGNFQLPPGFVAELGPLTIFTVDSTSLKGTWELNSRIIDPATLRFISEDINPFEIQ